ncbi:MAG: tripartite tricarboxylate transporter permease [Candidatus Micrarchaeota archaeon]
MIEEFLAGAAAGGLGILPFLHVNAILQVATEWLPGGEGLWVFVAALSLSHLVFSVLPSLILFLPGTDYVASLLPLQRMAQEGKAAVAIKAVAASTLAGLCIAAAALPLVAAALPLAKAALGGGARYLLLGVVVLFFASIRGWKSRAQSVAVFALSGLLGWVSLSQPLLQEPLFPLLTGLFAVPAILLARGESAKLVGNDAQEARFDLRLVLLGAAVGAVSSLLPGMSVSVLLCACLLAVKEDDAAFLSLAPALAASKTLYDLLSPVTVGKARSMGAVLLQDGGVGAAGAPIIAAAALAGAMLATAVLLLSYRKIAPAMAGLDMNRLRRAALAVLLAAIAVQGGVAGVLLAFSAACVGALPILLGLRRSLATGALLVPALCYGFGAA